MATLVYYDVFDFPLKKDEVFRYLVNFGRLSGGSAARIFRQSNAESDLEQLVKQGVVGMRGGYYFLFDREYLIPLRKKREKLAESKIRKTVRAAGWLRFVPYLRAVFASGSLAMGNTDELSDLDVLIIVKSGRIWLARFLITLCLSALRIRRKGSDKIAPNKICLNHYITEKSLTIPFKSIYNAQTYSNLIPVYARENNLVEEFKKGNDWVLDYVRGWGNINLENKKQLRRGFPGLVAGIGEAVLNTRFGDFLEKIARNYQFKRIAANSLTNKSGGRVIFNDRQLEFHPTSMEDEIIKKYNERLTKLEFAEFAREKNSGLLTRNAPGVD